MHDRRTPLIRLALASLALLLPALTACHKTSSQPLSVPPPPPSPPTVRNQNAYYNQVMNLSSWFRWTPLSGSSQIVVPIEVDDVNLPAGMTAADAEDIVVRGRDAWRSTVQSAAYFNTSTHFLSKDPPHSRSLLVLTIEFVDSLASPRLGQVGTAESGGRVLSMQMQLAARDPSGTPLTHDDMVSVAVHEFGHALGIANVAPGYGHSTDATDCMFASSLWWWKTLSGGDAETIKGLYRLTPTTIRFDG